MAESHEAIPREPAVGPSPVPVAALAPQIRSAILSVLVLTLVTGVAFPLVLFALARPLFPHQAGGSLLRRGGTVVGAEWVGQDFSGPGYFHPRPSATGYDARTSGGSNLSPANPKLHQEVRQRLHDYRRRNDLPPDSPVPIDAVTGSGSGLDPHISPANAALQVHRVARERRLGEAVVRQLVAAHTRGRQLGFLGEPRVAVLPFNLALDAIAPPAR
jgi:K+-transporting ATPase ATPase C chain